MSFSEDDFTKRQKPAALQQRVPRRNMASHTLTPLPGTSPRFFLRSRTARTRMPAAGNTSATGHISGRGHQMAGDYWGAGEDPGKNLRLILGGG